MHEATDAEPEWSKGNAIGLRGCCLVDKINQSAVQRLCAIARFISITRRCRAQRNGRILMREYHESGSVAAWPSSLLVDALRSAPSQTAFSLQ